LKLTHYLFGLCLFATAVRAQQANLSPSKADFGNVAVASTASQQVDFSNPTKKTLNIFSVMIDGDFSIPSFPCNLAMGELSGCGFQVTFTPTALGPRTGTLTITSDSPDSPHKVKLSGTGVPVQMISISVAPSTPTIPKGLTQQFFATGNFNNGTTQNITGSVVWSSSAPGVASIASGGLATTVTQGNTTIKATSAALSGSTVAAVGPPVLQSIRITPQMTAIPKGRTQQFVATGILTDGTTQDVTNSVQWTSTAIGVATINPAGLATGVAVGVACGIDAEVRIGPSHPRGT